MGIGEKIKGAAREKLGEFTGDENLRAEGQAQRRKGEAQTEETKERAEATPTSTRLTSSTTSKRRSKRADRSPARGPGRIPSGARCCLYALARRAASVMFCK
jgi:uncharacterized protein YjbJ (UPF0337 family)